MAHSTPSGMPLLNYALFTFSGYLYSPSDESDNDLMPNPDDTRSPFAKRGELEALQPEEQERKVVLRESAREFDELIASLSKRERLYMLNSFPGHALNQLSSMRGWKEEVLSFKEVAIQQGRLNMRERMKRHFQRRMKKK